MIIVCSLSDLNNICDSIKPSHVLSVIDPGFEPQTPAGVENHLKLGFDDIIEINNDKNAHVYSEHNLMRKQVLPSENHINSIINFVKSWNSIKPIIIHCWCGVSRSMAAATYLMCSLDNSNIDRNIKYIRSVAPHANPNKLMISIFENFLRVDNKISSAYKKYPHTTTYDCESNFAPVTIFNINDMKKFQ